ncbi:MAG: AAA family ATPase [Rhodospirillales bacterium]|nr:AAA family ATPase [Rhodospirillales bacterium]
MMSRTGSFGCRFGANAATGALKLAARRKIIDRGAILGHRHFRRWLGEMIMAALHRDDVFIAGGQPTITYVQRQDEHIENGFARAVATPNHIVSLSGPTKTGKTVLCKKILGERQYVWIDGGQISSGKDLWEKIAHELNLPSETTYMEAIQGGGTISAQVPLIVTASGSLLKTDTTSTKQSVNSMADALKRLISEKIFLVIDDFHYLTGEVRTEIVRNIKGAVFNGLKLILLSVTHRTFDVIKAENELTGRFTSVVLPHWNQMDLEKIAIQGFEALKVECSKTTLELLASEAQESPFLMQKFCWELCFDLGIETAHGMLGKHKIPKTYDFKPMFIRLAEDSGLPIYQRLKAGPQSRKVREKRPLHTGKSVDIYEAILLALAKTGPKPQIDYDDFRTIISELLSDKVPQKHEITSALKHLSLISRSTTSMAIDWDEENRTINLADPYLRFYLRWQVREEA